MKNATKSLKIFYLYFFPLTLLFIFSSYSEPTQLIEGKDYIVVARDAGGGGYEAFPDICRLNDGRLLCVFYEGYAHVSMPNKKFPNGGKIAGCFSSDEGKTWTEPFTIYDSEYDDRDPSISIVDNQKLICNFFTLKPKDNNWEGLGTWIVTSNDFGKTWSQPKNIIKNYYTSSPIRKLPNGVLVISLYAGREKKGCGAVSFSSDGGETWSSPVDIDTGELNLDAEPDVCIIESNKLYIAQRGHNSEPMGYAVSENYGKTWSVSKSLNFPGHCPYLHRAPFGAIILGLREPVRKGTYIRISTDEAKSWSEPILVDSCIGAYPSMVTLKDNSILIVYYEEGEGSNIRARKFRINEENQVEWITWQ